MTQSGRVDYEAVSRAQARLLSSRRLSTSDLVAAYRVVRTATPDAYTEKFVAALISQAYGLSAREARLPVLAEAVEVAREAATADPRHLKVLTDTLGTYQRGLYDAERRAEGFEACREQARIGEQAYEAGAVTFPLYGSWNLACRLAEEGDHAQAATLFEAMVRNGERGPRTGDDFWTKIAWIAETEAAGDHTRARGAMRMLVDQDKARAEQETGPYARVIWELLLLASMDREHGREADAEACDSETEEVLTLLASKGEPKNWSNILAWWAVLAGLTGRTQDRPALGEPEPPLFASLDWSPDLRRTYLGPGRENLQAEIPRLAELAERDPASYLGRLVEVQRKHTLRSITYWKNRSWRVTDELRGCFDEGVRLSRELVELDEPMAVAALSRALADRAAMHVAARDFPPALRDFRESHRAVSINRHI